MTVLADVHESHNAIFQESGGRRIVSHYGRPESAHRAVRNVVGVIEHCYDVLVITGSDRLEYVDNAVSNVVPPTDGQGTYALLLDPQGRIETDMYVFNGDERLLIVLPPGNGEPLAEEWREKTFIQDVDIAVETDSFATLGVHGPKATEKIASVFSEQTPDQQLSFVRGGMGDEGVTVVRTDALAGEEGYLVVCGADAAVDVFDSLENRGLNAAPFGYRTWESLTLEAGTPLFETELDGTIPNDLGLRNAVDFEKGCFVGQEVVSRIENRGQPSKNLVGLTLKAVPTPDATVFAGDETVGAVTRGLESPSREQPIALALIDSGARTESDATGELTVRVDGTEVPAQRVSLPFVSGSERSARCPTY